MFVHNIHLLFAYASKKAEQVNVYRQTFIENKESEKMGTGSLFPFHFSLPFFQIYQFG